MIRMVASALIAGSLWTTPGLAQEAAPDPNGPDEVETSSAKDTPGAEAQPDADPFEYEASEQISEDLSVSFPVDI